ncbi:hypothetical protein KY309_00390 [Candidatus Woesearchaeota archaeon]|nr:hypothetical protein [Candidatus Woesearchaeota archaeon]MBW3016051.1 hypothetical protein [Candidatus Woesearchaeota archaeon]
MKQKLVFEKVFPDPFEEDEEELVEDRLNEESPWELAFERGVEAANNEMIERWEEEDFE